MVAGAKAKRLINHLRSTMDHIKTKDSKGENYV